MKPYTNIKVSNSEIIRVFDENIDPIELQWHRDREERIVISTEHTNWMIQLENQLPISLNEKVRIPKKEWHRLIKGDGNLKLSISLL